MRKNNYLPQDIFKQNCYDVKQRPTRQHVGQSLRVPLFKQETLKFKTLTYVTIIIMVHLEVSHLCKNVRKLPTNVPAKKWLFQKVLNFS